MVVVYKIQRLTRECKASNNDHGLPEIYDLCDRRRLARNFESVESPRLGGYF